MAGTNLLSRVTAKLFTDFAYYSSVYADDTTALDDDNYIKMELNVSGDDNKIYGIVTHPITSDNEVYDSTSDATNLKATLYMQQYIQVLKSDGKTEYKSVWFKIGEPQNITAGTIFKFEGLRAATYKLAVTGTGADNYAVNVSYQYEPGPEASSIIKYLFPERPFNEIGYTQESNALNNIGEYNTKAISSTTKEETDFAPNA